MRKTNPEFSDNIVKTQSCIIINVSLYCKMASAQDSEPVYCIEFYVILSSITKQALCELVLIWLATVEYDYRIILCDLVSSIFLM